MTTPSQTVTSSYLDGIREGRSFLKQHGADSQAVADHISNLKVTMKGFSAASPVGQLLRGELDFWKNQSTVSTK